MTFCDINSRLSLTIAAAPGNQLNFCYLWGQKNNSLPTFISPPVYTNNQSNTRLIKRRQSPNLLHMYIWGFHKTTRLKDTLGI